MKKIKPRPHQKECLVAIDAAIANGEKRALVVMASSLGKTFTSAFAVEKFFAGRNFGRVLILCHSEPILRQSKKKFKEYFGDEYNYGMYTSSEKATHPTSFLFATLQTMKEHRKKFAKDTFDYIIVDEAHHSQARTYFPAIRYFTPQFLLGLTATPDRLDGQKIEEIYGDPVYELGFVDSTKRGLITECDYRLILDDLSQEKLDAYLQSGEKLSINQLNNTLFIEKRDEEIIRLIRQHSANVEDPKTMIFCRSIEHARKITKLMGDEVGLVHNGQSSTMNEIALQAFRDGELRTIVSVQMLNEGVDIPDANIVVFLRNTVSPAIFYQQLGRGTRLAEGKNKVLVLDFVKNCDRIKTVFELKQKIDDTQGTGSTGPREYFSLNIATPEFKTRVVDIVTLLEQAAERRTWTKEEIVQGMQDMYRRGEKVTAKAIDQNPDMPHSTTVIEMFGGKFNNALKEAGLCINQRDRVVTSRNCMIAEGKKMVSMGEQITYKTIEQNLKLPHPATVAKEFGSIINYATLCGQENIVKDTSREGMIKAYWEASKNINQWLSLKAIDRDQTLTYARKYRDKFGNKETLVELAQQAYGPLLTKDEQKQQIEKELNSIKQKLIRDYYEASCRKGRWLMKTEFKKANGVSSLARYNRYIGGIKELISLAREQYGDLGKTMTASRQTQHKTDDMLIEEYYQESKKAGNWLSNSKVDKHQGLACSVTYFHRFGGIKKVRQLAIEAHGDFTKELVTN